MAPVSLLDQEPLLDPGRFNVPVIGTGPAQGALTVGDLRVELVDQMQCGGGVVGPGFG